MKNAAPAPASCRTRPASARTEGARADELHRVEAHGGEQLVVRDELGHERLPRGDVETGGDARQAQQPDDDLGRRDPARPHREQPERDDHHRSLRPEQDELARVAIRERSGQRSDDQRGEERHERADAEPGGRARELVEDVRRRDRLHPRAGVRHQRRAPEDRVVAVAQHPEGVPHSPAARRRGRGGHGRNPSSTRSRSPEPAGRPRHSLSTMTADQASRTDSGVIGRSQRWPAFTATATRPT